MFYVRLPYALLFASERNSLIEEDVVLRAHPHRGTNDIHVSPNVSPINVGCTRCRREETSQDRPMQSRTTHTVSVP